jgi:ABC-type phosphate transport system substrate-binding protein
MKRILIVLAALLALAGARGANAQGYVVVVNASNSASSLSKAEVSNIFLKKSSRLSPVDLSKNSPVRDAFSRAVHGRPAAAIASYWQQQIFAGKDVPPAEKASDAEVLSYVRSTPNGIGYVSAGAALGSGVKAVTVQ